MFVVYINYIHGGQLSVFTLNILTLYIPLRGFLKTVINITENIKW